MKLWRWHHLLLPVLTGAVLWGCWRLAAWLIYRAQVVGQGADSLEAESVRRLLLPLPGEMWSAFLIHRGAIADAAYNTFMAALAGFLCAVLMGTCIALLLASSLSIKRALYPWVLVLQMTPVIILAPILAIWMGQGMLSIVAVTFLIGFFPIVANTTMGLLSTDQNLLDLFAVCNASKWQEFAFLRVPFAMPFFLTGLRIAGTLAPIGAIAGDIFVGSSANQHAGLGFLTLVFRATLNTPALYATAAVACVLGFVFVGCINLLHWWVLHKWHDSMVKNRE